VNGENKEKEVSSATAVRVEIYNQTYSIRSFDDDSEYIMKLAEFVDNKMREISSKALTADSLKVAILAALHIADEYHRLQSVHDQADEQLASRSAECAEMLDRLLKAKPLETQDENGTNIAETKSQVSTS